VHFTRLVIIKKAGTVYS